MFRMIICGKTIDELKNNMREMSHVLQEGLDEIEQDDVPVRQPGKDAAPPTGFGRGEMLPPSLVKEEPRFTEGAQGNPAENPFGRGAIPPTFSPTPPAPQPEPLRPAPPHFPSSPAQSTAGYAATHAPAHQSPASSVSASTASATTNDFGVDSRGWPWDERIHAVTQGVNKDGSWRNRRGVEPSVLAQVEAELSAKYGSKRGAASPVHTVQPTTSVPPPASPFGPPPGIPTQPTPEVFSQPAGVAHSSQATPAPTTPGPTSIAPVISAHTPQTFREHTVAILARLVSEGKLTQDYINSLKAYFKVDQIWSLSPEQSNEMFENFVQVGLIVRAQ